MIHFELSICCDCCSLFLICYVSICIVFFLMIRRPPRSTRTDTLFPYTTLFRSTYKRLLREAQGARNREARIEAARRVWYRGFVAERSEEHTSELQSLMRISYAVFCLKKKKTKIKKHEQTRKQKRKNTTQHTQQPIIQTLSYKT